jgi:hypothetical protein
LNIAPIAVLLSQDRRQIIQAFIANRNAGTGEKVLYVVLTSAAETAREIFFARYCWSQ